MTKKFALGAIAGLLLLAGYLMSSRSNTQLPAATQALNSVQGRVIYADIERPGDAFELTRNASLILIGTPRSIEREVPTGSSAISDYYQSISVERVLKGTAPAVVRTVRAGISSGALAIGETESEDLTGPLSAIRQVLFLQPSAKEGVWQIVGYTSGAMRFDNSGRVTTTDPAAKVFDGLDSSALEQKVKALVRVPPAR